MIDDKIKIITIKFAFATKLCLKTGYDGIEFHGVNNYLIQPFYSLFCSKSTDNS